MNWKEFFKPIKIIIIAVLILILLITLIFPIKVESNIKLNENALYKEIHKGGEAWWDTELNIFNDGTIEYITPNKNVSFKLKDGDFNKLLQVIEGKKYSIKTKSIWKSIKNYIESKTIIDGGTASYYINDNGNTYIIFRHKDIFDVIKDSMIYNEGERDYVNGTYKLISHGKLIDINETN